MLDNNQPFEDYPAQNNYDMTILHMNFDDESDESSIFATKSSTHQKKPIPQWARSKFTEIECVINDICEKSTLLRRE